MAVYGMIQPTQQASIPYWCSSVSAFNDSEPTGYISLSDPVFQKALPVDAKHSLRLLVDDLQGGVKKALDYYGTVFNIGGKVVKYDPNLMTAQVNMTPKDDFLQNAGAEHANGSGTLKTGQEAPASGNALENIKKTAEQHPVAVGSGLLLMLFGIGAILSSKKRR